MWLLMLRKDWSEMDIQTATGQRAKVKGYLLPIEGGGRIQATAFMPLFDSYEHAEAARGNTNAPIYEIIPVPPEADPGDFQPFEPGEDPQWI